MDIEQALGTLIRKLNPYTNGKPGAMQLSHQAAAAATNSDPEHAKAVAEAKARAEGKTAQQVTQDGEQAAKAVWEARKAAVEADAKTVAEAKARAEGKTWQQFTQDGEEAAKAAWTALIADATLDLSKVEVEVDNNSYAADWTFKGQPQSIKRAIRIKYCYPSRDKDGKILCWVTEHVIVGYAGANGG